MKYDLTNDLPGLIFAYRTTAICVLVVEIALFSVWVASTTWWFGFAAFFTWAAASLYVIRIIAVMFAIVFIAHPERIDTYAILSNAETKSAQTLRKIGLTSTYYPMLVYGMFIRVIHPCLIITMLIVEATLLFRFPYPRLLFINIGFGAVVVVQGYITYHVWRVFGVIRPRMMAMARHQQLQ
ncbi:MAG: hypothetical protein AB7P49_00015 [Bdellovibrionales bacterium]